jgi:hypothetical protein
MIRDVLRRNLQVTRNMMPTDFLQIVHAFFATLQDQVMADARADENLFDAGN